MVCLSSKTRRKISVVIRIPKTNLRVAVCFRLTIVAVLGHGLLVAQLPHLAPGKAVNVREYFAAPNHRQMKFQISGAEAQPLEGGKQMQITGMKLQLLKETG